VCLETVAHLLMIFYLLAVDVPLMPVNSRVFQNSSEGGLQWTSGFHSVWKRYHIVLVGIALVGLLLVVHQLT
jgi:hypothetical protein